MYGLGRQTLVVRAVICALQRTEQRKAVRDGWSCVRTAAGLLFSAVKQNIDDTGRTARGGMGILFLLIGGCLVPVSAPLAVIFLALGLFCLFEAWRGWCAVRACGIKTPF